MDDEPLHRFFLHPSSPHQRQYESFPRRLRREPLPERGRHTLRLLLRGFPPVGAPVPHRQPRRCPAPLFGQPRRGQAIDRSEPATEAAPAPPATADARDLSLAPGRSIRTRLAGVFLFLPLLVRLRFDELVTKAGYPGSEMIPGRAALQQPCYC
jgi:hypothetical protein